MRKKKNPQELNKIGKKWIYKGCTLSMKKLGKEKEENREENKQR